MKKQANQQNVEYNRLADEHNKTVSMQDQLDESKLTLPFLDRLGVEQEVGLSCSLSYEWIDIDRRECKCDDRDARREICVVGGVGQRGLIRALR